MQYYILSIIFSFFLLYNNTFSFENKIWDNWYFGRKAAITFNTPDRMPKPLNDSKINTLEGCASISDTSGNILFYTNGVFVYNKNGDVMPNGTELNGHYSSTQSALIVKRPKSKNLYHIFTTDKGPYEGDSRHNLCVSLVDMNLDSGRGDVTVKNYEIYEPVIEKLTAIQHANGLDYWIIARGMNDNKFIISLLNEGGIVSTKTMEFGPTYYPFPASPEFSLGQLKANPKGNMLATVVYGANNVELYQFDNSTGLITSYQPIPVNEAVTALYGLEFSSNNKFLYVNNLYGRIYQYDVSQFDSSKIQKSMKIVFDSLDYSFQKFGQLQLAPNGKIYMALSYDTCLAVIHKPNVPSPFCRYSPKDVGLNGRLSLFGLPNNVITGIYYSVDIYGKSICADMNDSLELFSIVYPEDIGYVYSWTGPDGFKSNLPNPKILNAKRSASGKYICNVSIDGSFFKADSTELFVYETPKAGINGPSSICPPELIKLTSKYQSPEYIYKWSTGARTSEIIISSPGDYYLIVTNPAGCYDSVFHRVTNDDNLSITFDNNQKLCKGTPLEISLIKELYQPLSNFKFKWSNGDTTISTIVNSPGYYAITVIRAGGCSGTDSIYVEELDPPVVKLNVEGTVRLCKGDSLLLEPDKPNQQWNYNWTDGIFAKTPRYVYQSGKYTLVVNNKGYCQDSASVNVIFEDKPDVELSFDNSLILCYGDSVKIQPKNLHSDYLYKWNDESPNPEKIVKASGKFKLYASNTSGCIDSSEVEVIVAPKIDLNIIADKTYLCLVDSVTLSANTRYFKYLWSNGDTNDFIRVYNPGKYRLIVSNNIGCTDTSEIEIKGINFESSMNKNKIQIDSICQGTETSEKIEINYKSNEALVFSDYNYTGDSFNFTIDESFKQLDANNFVHSINFIVGKNQPGTYQGEIIFTIEKPCFNQFSIPVYVKVYSDYKFEVNHIVAQPGDSACILVDISLQCGNGNDFLYSPEFDLKLKSEYFYPAYVKGGTIISNISDGIDRILHLKMDEQTFPNGTKRRMEICGLVISGQKPVSAISVQSPEWWHINVNSVLEDGSILVEGCSQDLRIIKIYKPITMSISPSPANSFAEISIKSQEVGKHFVELYSIDGRLLRKVELDGFSSNNSQIVRINTQDFTQGFYQVVLKSPWNVLTGNIFIIKN
jgi:hypothetical protein